LAFASFETLRAAAPSRGLRLRNPARSFRCAVNWRCREAAFCPLPLPRLRPWWSSRPDPASWCSTGVSTGTGATEWPGRFPST